MASDLELGQKLGMSLDELIKKTQASKKKTKPAAEKEKPAKKSGAKTKPASQAKGKRQPKATEHQLRQQTGAIKKTTAKKTTAKKAAAPNARAATHNAPKRVPANPRNNRNAQQSHTRVGDLLNMQVAVSSKKDAQAAMKMAKQLEAEARKFLGPPAPNPRQQQQQRPQQQQQRPQQQQQRPQRQVQHRQTQQQRHAPQQRRVPYSPAQTSHYPMPHTENFLADDDRLSDSDQMDMEDVDDIKPALASLQAQANQFARGVRGQSRR